MTQSDIPGPAVILLSGGLDSMVAAALARELTLSPTRLREIVKADFGVPPSKLLQWLQLLGAAKAMEASSSLADAAAAGGFADQAHFTRRLQQWFGVTPKIGLSGLEVSVDDLS